MPLKNNGAMAEQAAKILTTSYNKPYWDLLLIEKVKQVIIVQRVNVPQQPWLSLH